MITVPNAKMVDTHVDNYGARRYRRTKLNIGVTYSTPPEKLDAFCEGIRELVRLHPYTRKDYYHIYFNSFGDSALVILVYIFFEVPDWGTELRERHHFLLDVIRLARKLGIDFAFPTMTLWHERASKDQAGQVVTIPCSEDAPNIGLQQALAVYEETYDEKSSCRPPLTIVTAPHGKPKLRPGE